MGLLNRTRQPWDEQLPTGDDSPADLYDAPDYGGMLPDDQGDAAPTGTGVNPAMQRKSIGKRLLSALPSMLQGGIAAAATPNIGGGGPVDVFRGMEAARNAKERSDLIQYNMKRQEAVEARQEAEAQRRHEREMEMERHNQAEEQRRQKEFEDNQKRLKQDAIDKTKDRQELRKRQLEEEHRRELQDIEKNGGEAANPSSVNMQGPPMATPPSMGPPQGNPSLEGAPGGGVALNAPPPQMQPGTPNAPAMPPMNLPAPPPEQGGYAQEATLPNGQKQVFNVPSLAAHKARLEREKQAAQMEELDPVTAQYLRDQGYDVQPGQKVSKSGLAGIRETMRQGGANDRNEARINKPHVPAARAPKPEQISAQKYFQAAGGDVVKAVALAQTAGDLGAVGVLTAQQRAANLASGGGKNDVAARVNAIKGAFGIKTPTDTAKKGPQKGDKKPHNGADYVFDGEKWVKQ